MPTTLTLERPILPTRRSSIIIPTILHDERHPHSLTDLSPFLFSYPLFLPIVEHHPTMDIQQAQDLLKKFSLGKYALPQGITPGNNPQAEHLYHMTQALRDASGGTPIVQALAQIPTYQQALVQQAIPTEKFAQVNAILAQLERREMNESQAASALRQLATTPVTSQLGQLSQSVQMPTVSRQEREAQIQAAGPRIGAWQDRTAQNAGVPLDKVKSVFKSFSDEQLAAVEAPDQTRVIKSGGGGGKTDVVVAMITDAVVNRGMRATDFTVLVATHSAEGELVRRLTDIGNTIPQMRLDWAGQVKTFHAKAMSTLNQRVMQASGQAMTPLQAMGMGAYTPFPSSSSSSRKVAPKNAEEAFRAQTQEEFKYFQNLLTHHGVRVQQAANLFQQIQAIKAEHGYDGQYKDMGIRGAQSWASGKKDAFESLLYMYEKARMNDPQFKLPSQTGPHYDLADSIILAARAGERGKTQPWKNTVVDEMQDPTRQMYRMLAAQTRDAAGYRFFAGDEGQRTIKSGGSYQAGQAIQEMFPTAKAFPLTGNYRLGPINTAMYSATQMEQVLDNRGRAPFQISMRAGGAEAFPSMYTATSFKQVNEQMFADYLKRQGLTHAQVAGNITAGAHPLSGASSPGSMPFVFQMKEQRRYFLKTIEHVLTQKVGPAKAKVAVRQMFNQGTPQGTGGNQAYALLVNQTLGKSFPHEFADITRVGSKWSDADYMEQMGVVSSRPTEQLHAYSSQTNIAGSNYTLAPDTLHGQAVPTGMASWYQWMLHNLVGVQGMSPSSLSAADQQLLASPMASRVQAPTQNLSSFQGFVEDVIKLIPHARPSAGAGIGTPAIHSATTVGVTASSERYGDESTTVNGISDRGSFQRILGTAKPEPDKTRIDLIVGYARNLLEQAGKTTLHMKGMTALPGNQGFMVNEGASTWETQDQDELSIESLMKSGMFGYQGGKERKAANKEITDYMAPTTSDDWSPYFNEKSRLMSGDHDRFGYRGKDEQKLRQGISDFLSSDLVRQHPHIKPLIEGAFTRESVRNVVADPKNAPNTYERQIFTQSPVIKTIQDYAYAQRSDEGQRLLQQVNAASEQGRLDPFIRNLVNNPKDDLLREEILNKAADVVSYGYLPPEAIEAIKSAAEEFNYPALIKLIDAYGDTLYLADNSQVGLRQVDMDYIKANHPREHALLSALAEKSGVDLSNLEDPAVQKQVAMLPYVAGQMTRAAGEKGQSLGIPIAESAFAPFTTEMSALSHNLSKTGILDPMALRSGSIDDVLMNISPDMSHALLHQLPSTLQGGGKTLPILGQDALLGGLSPLEREVSLGLPSQSEGVGVGLEGYQKRLENLLSIQGHKLSPEQAHGYRSELEQVRSLRKTLGDPSFQLESGHLLNIVHRAATGESAIDKNVKGEHNQPYARFMAPLKNQFGEGNRTLGSIGELVSSLQEGTRHVQGTGTLSRAHTNRILEALGHDPSEFENLTNLESLAGFGEGSSLPLTALAAQFPSDQKNLLAQFTRFPFKEGQTAAFMGGMPGFTDIAPLGQEKAGLHAGMVGTLHPINKGISFGLPTDYGDFKKHGLFTESEWKEHGPRAQDPEFLKQVAEPLAMLRTRGGKQYPVRLSQVSDLYAKGLHPDAQEMLDISRHNVMTGDIKGAVSRRGHRDIRVQGWLKTPSGQRYLARQSKQNEPTPPALSPSAVQFRKRLRRFSSGAPSYDLGSHPIRKLGRTLLPAKAESLLGSHGFSIGGVSIPQPSQLANRPPSPVLVRTRGGVLAYRQAKQPGGGATPALSPSLRAQIEGANETQAKIPVSNTPPPEAFMPEGFIGGSLGAASPFAQGPILGEANQQRIVRNLQNIVPGQLKGLSPRALDEYIRKKQLLLAKSAQDVSQQGRPLDLAAAFLDAFTIQAAQQKSGWVSPLHSALVAHTSQITHPFLQQRLGEFPPAKDSPLGQLKEKESYLGTLRRGWRDNYGNTRYGSPEEIQKQEDIIASLKQQLAGGSPPSPPPEAAASEVVSPPPDLQAQLEKQYETMHALDLMVQKGKIGEGEGYQREAKKLEDLKQQLARGSAPLPEAASVPPSRSFAHIDGEEPALSIWANKGAPPPEVVPDAIEQLHQTLLSHPDNQPYGGSIAPDTMNPPPQLEEPLPASQLEMLSKGLREGNSNWGIHPPSDEQKKYMLDPAQRTVLEGGPGTGKTATGVRGQMYQVATGAILPRNTFAFSAIRSATSRLAGEYGKYRKLLPSGKDYDFPTPRTFASIAASTVLHPEHDENNQSYFPMLQKLGYKHLTGEVMGDPTAQDLYGKDEETQVKMMRTSQKAFLTEQINASLVASGKKPWDTDSQALRDAQKYIGETKKGRIGGYGTFEQIARGEKVAQEPYSHGIQKGMKDLAAGQMTQEATLVLHEQGMRKKGGMDWDDLFSIAIEAYQKFGPQALPTAFKHIEAMLVDEGQDVNPLMASLQKHFIGALSANNPRVTVAMDIPQSLTQGMSGVPLENIRGTYRDILGLPEATPFHTLSHNFRSDANTVAFHNALLSSPALADSPHSPLQVAHSQNAGKPWKYMLGKTQPDVYRQMFRGMLGATGLPNATIKQNIKSGQHPFTGASTLPKEIAAILPRNQDTDLFTHLGKQELQSSLGLSEQEAASAFSQMMRQGMPPASLQEHTPEWDAAQMQMPLLRFMGSRGNDFEHVFTDASFTGAWQRNEDVAGHARNLNVGLTRVKAGGQQYVGAAELPFNFTEAQRYMQGGGMNLARMAYGKRGSANTFEDFQGQAVPRFFRDLSQGAHTQLQQWGMNPDAGRKVVDSSLVVNAKDVKMNIPPGGSVSIQGTNVQAPGGITIVRSSTPPPPGSKWAAASSPAPNNLPPAASSSSATGFNPFAPPRRGGPLGSYTGTSMGGQGGTSGSGTININATGNPPPPDTSGRINWNNGFSQAGRSLARLGFELQFVGKSMEQTVDPTIIQGSEYRRATYGLTGSGTNGTSGFFNFNNAGFMGLGGRPEGTISSYQNAFLPMYSKVQIAQGLQNLVAASYNQGIGTGSLTDVMGLSAIAGLDPTQLGQQMAYLGGVSGQAGSSRNISNLSGMLTNLYGTNLTGANVTPTLSSLQSVLPTVAGLSPGTPGASSQVMSIFSAALTGGMSPQNLPDVASLIGGLSQAGSSPGLTQQFALQRLGYNLTADTSLAEYQQEQTQRNMQMASLGLQQNINEPVAGIFGGRSTGAPLSLPHLQIQIDQAQITMDKAELTMGGIQLAAAQVGQQGAELQYQYGKASYGFNLAMQNALYGPIGKDYSQLAGYSFQQNQLVAQRNYTSPEIGTMFTPQNVSGLRNQEFYAGLQNQQQSLILGRSPLLSDALFQQQMKYIAQQADYYKQELALRNQQRQFDMVWQKRLLDQQGAQVAAQGRIVAYQGYIYSLQQSQFKLEQEKSVYDQKQAAIQQQFLAKQQGDLEAINTALNQMLMGQGPVSRGNLNPADLLQQIAKVTQGNPAALRGYVRELAPGDTASQNTLYQLVTAIQNNKINLKDLQKQLQSANDAHLVALLKQATQNGNFADMTSQRTTADQALAQGGTGGGWQRLVDATNTLAYWAPIIGQDLSNLSAFLKLAGPLILWAGTVAVTLGAILNTIGFIKTIWPLLSKLPDLFSHGVPGPVNLPQTGTVGATAEETAAGGGLAGIIAAVLPTVIIAMAGAGFIYFTYKVAEYLDSRSPQKVAADQNSVTKWIASQPWLSWLKPSPAYIADVNNPKSPSYDPTSPYFKKVPPPPQQDNSNSGPPVTSSAQAAIYAQYAKAGGPGSVSTQEANTHLKNMEGYLHRVQDNTTKINDKTKDANVIHASNNAKLVNLNNLHTQANMVQQRQALIQKNTDTTLTHSDTVHTTNKVQLANIAALHTTSNQTQIRQELIAKNSDGTLSTSSQTQNQIKADSDAQVKGILTPAMIAAGIQQGFQIPEQSARGGSTPVGHPGFITPNVNAEFHQQMKYGIHQGVDFAAAQGTPIGAFNPGRVTNTGFYPWGGEVDVNIGHGLTERYIHLSQIGVVKGEPLLPRQRIGLTGGGTPASGLGRWSSGAHSHVQIDRGNILQGIDPWPIWALLGSRDISSFYGSGWGTTKGHGGPGMESPRKLAEGGIAIKRVMAEIGEGKEPEAVLPLSRLSTLLKSASGSSQNVQPVAQPTKTIQVSRLADKFEIHVHTTAAKLDDQAIDDLGAQFFDILTTQLQKL